MKSLALALGLLGACSAREPAPPAPSPTSPAPPSASPRDVPVPAERFVGVVTAARSVVLAPLVAGVLTKVHVGPGDAVATGQVVAELDAAQLREGLAAAEATHAAARASSRVAKLELDDARRRLALETRAVAGGVSPAQNLEEARNAVMRAEANLDQARSSQAVEAARAQTARGHVESTTLRAPFAGVVAVRYLDAGNRVDAGASVVRIDGNGGMRLSFAVPPEQVAAVAVASRVTATIETIAEPVSAVVKQVSPAVDPASGMVLIEAELATEHRAVLRAGLAAWVSL